MLNVGAWWESLDAGHFVSELDSARFLSRADRWLLEKFVNVALHGRSGNKFGNKRRSLKLQFGLQAQFINEVVIVVRILNLSDKTCGVFYSDTSGKSELGSKSSGSLAEDFIHFFDSPPIKSLFMLLIRPGARVLERV